jgi:hypothetical protein
VQYKKPRTQFFFKRTFLSAKDKKAGTGGGVESILMDIAEFNYPGRLVLKYFRKDRFSALDSSSEEGEWHEEEDDGDHYALDVSSVESPIRTPILNDTSNSNANDTQVVICDEPQQSPEINLYDDLIGENPQESVRF